jgi:AraC family transcriptional regulator
MMGINRERDKMEKDPDGVRTRHLREEYVLRINRVIDYIEGNLEKDLSLDKLSDIACFSRFHFHRVFSAIVGENLGQFIQRVRLERAAAKLLQNPKKSITGIAFEYGFSSSAVFARAFKDTFGVSAGQWRAQGRNSKSKIRNTESNIGKAFRNVGKESASSSLYIEGDLTQQTWRIAMREKPQFSGEVVVRDVPEMQVAYIRHIGPYAGNEDLFRGLTGRLMQWAGPRGLIRFPETKMLTIYYDDPSITEESRLRIDVCLSVPKGTPTEGEVGSMTIPGGKNAVGRFEISSDQFGEAWNAVYGEWMPQSGYQPDDRPCYEVALNDPTHHPERKHIIEIYAPVKPL